MRHTTPRFTLVALALAATTSLAHANVPPPAPTSGVEGYFDGATEVATLSWNTVGTLTTFALDFITAPTTGAHGAFVDLVRFQGTNGTFHDTDTTALSTGTFASGVDASYHYDWTTQFSVAGSPAQLPNRLVVGETATWTINGPTSFDLDGSLLHINNYVNGNSIKIFSSPVPEPGSSTLLLAGLALMGLVATRRGTR